MKKIIRWFCICAISVVPFFYSSCGSEDTGPTSLCENIGAGSSTGLVIVSGNAQTAAPGATLEPLVVKMTDDSGNPMANEQLQVSTGGSATFTGGAVSQNPTTGTQVSGTLSTGSDGTLSISFTLGTEKGIYSVLVKNQQLNKNVSFCETAATGPDAALLDTVLVGSLPQGINVDTTSNQVFVGNNGNQNGCDFIALTNVQSQNMSVIDGNSYEVTRTIDVGSSPIYPVPNPANRRLYVGQAQIKVLDLADNFNVLASISSVGSVHQGAVDTTNNEVWFNDAINHRAFVVDPNSNDIVGTVTTGTGTSGPHGLALNTATRRVYTPNLDENSVSVINAATRTKITDIAIGASVVGIAVNSTTNKVYVTVPNSQKIVVIDGSNNTVSKTLDLGVRMLELAVDETRNRIYATQQSLPYGVAAIDGSNDTLLGVHPGGLCPWGVAVNSQTNRIYVTNQGNNSVSVYDGAQLP